MNEKSFDKTIEEARKAAKELKEANDAQRNSIIEYWATKLGITFEEAEKFLRSL